MAATIALEALTKTFDDGTQAVRAIDLTIEQGEFVVLLGPSGCGKTTTLRMIAGLDSPTTGTIRLEGKDLAGSNASQRDVGFVFQFYALYPRMNVRDNTAFPLEAMRIGRSERRKRALEILERVGLAHAAHRFPAQLPGGDQQRVALARAMVRRPKAWLMDEPLGTLDAPRRLALREFIRAQQLEHGVTTVYVTHDQEEAMALADRVVVMEGGRICQAAPPMEVYARPTDLFVADFVGSPGMNQLRGTSANGRFTAEGGGEGHVTLPALAPEGVYILGIRPEFVQIGSEGPLWGRVVQDEYLGTHRNLHVDTPLGRVVARALPQEGHKPGAQVCLHFEQSQILLFDPESGTRSFPDA